MLDILISLLFLGFYISLILMFAFFVIDKKKREKIDFQSISLVTLTLLWLILVYQFTSKDFFEEFGIKLITSNKFNEWGDYLAGFFAPIIFLWLVYGVFIQKKEFKNVVDEYKKSVEILKKQSIHTDIQHKNAWFDRKVEMMDSYIKHMLKDKITIEKLQLSMISNKIDEYKDIMYDLKRVVELNLYIHKSLSEIPKELQDSNNQYLNAMSRLKEEYNLSYGQDVLLSKKMLLKIYLQIFLSKVIIDDNINSLEENDLKDLKKEKFKGFYEHINWLNDEFLNLINGSEYQKIEKNDSFIDIMFNEILKSNQIENINFEGKK